MIPVNTCLALIAGSPAPQCSETTPIQLGLPPEGRMGNLEGTYLFSYIVCVFLCKMQVAGLACLSTDVQVLAMCESGHVTGKGVYLDTTAFTELSVTCTCTLQSSGTGGIVTFDPVVIDKTNCQATILMDDYRFVHDCRSDGDRVGYMPVGASIRMTVQGEGRVANCLKVYTEVPDMALNVTCYKSATVTSTSATTLATTTPSLSTMDVTTSGQTSSAHACLSSDLSVLNMCERRSVEAWRLYIDSSLFTDQYSSCTCTVRVVNGAGGSLAVYPHVVDHSNCNTNIYVDKLSFFIGCTTYNSAKTFLNQSSTLDFEIYGKGSSNHCVLLQASSPDTTLRVDCSMGILSNITRDTSSTTATSPTITKTTSYNFEFTTSEKTTDAVTLSTEDTLKTATSSSETSESTTTTQSPRPSTSATFTATKFHDTTEPTSPTLSETTEPTSPTLPDTLSLSPSPSDVSSHSTSNITLESTASSSAPTTASNGSRGGTTTVRGRDDSADTFPVTEVVVGISVGVAFILFIAAVLLCYRHRNDDKNGEEQQMLHNPPSVVKEDMREIETVTVENPVYYHADNFPRLSSQTSQSVMMTDGVTSPGDINDLYAIVNKDWRSIDTVLY